MFRITQGQKLGLCVDKELERIIAEQCFYICLRGKAIAKRPSRSRSFTSQRPLILMVTSRDLAVRHKSHNKGPLNKPSQRAEGHCSRLLFLVRISCKQPTKKILV